MFRKSFFAIFALVSFFVSTSLADSELFFAEFDEGNFFKADISALEEGGGVPDSPLVAMDDPENPVQQITAPIEFPTFVTVDSAGDKVYWGDRILNGIFRANRDG
jgi:hypothetical protein